jgi:hypothetical protein
VIDWFFRTHEAEAVGMGGVIWRQKHLPDDGPIGEQDAKGTAQLAHARAVANHLLRQKHTRGDAAAESRAFHQAVVREQQGKEPTT